MRIEVRHAGPSASSLTDRAVGHRLPGCPHDMADGNDIKGVKERMKGGRRERKRE